MTHATRFMDGAPRAIRALLLGSLSLTLTACDDHPKPAAPQPAPTQSTPTPAPTPQTAAPATPTSRLDRFAQAIAQASPTADPSDNTARDKAARKLAKLAELIDSGEAYVLWGQYEAAKALDLNAYYLTALEPLVAIKIYLSLFTFSGPHTITHDGTYTILQMPAAFRDRLDPGAYPVPFWHSPDEWRGYARTANILLVFKDETLLAILHDDARTNATTTVPTWDGKWSWTDAKGQPQPRASTYSFLLSPENPEAPALQDDYDALRMKFIAYNCLACHTHDASPAPTQRFVLSDPVHTLAVSDLLEPLLSSETLQPTDPHRNRPDGIADDAARDELIALAEQFQMDAENALLYEAARRATNDPE